MQWLQVAKGCFVAAFVEKMTNGGLRNQRLSHWCVLMGERKGRGSNALYGRVRKTPPEEQKRRTIFGRSQFPLADAKRRLFEPAAEILAGRSF